MSEEYDDLGPVVNPDGTPTQVTKDMFGVTDITMDEVMRVFTTMAQEFGFESPRFERTIGVGDWGDTHSLFVLIGTGSGDLAWTVRHRDGNHWSLEFSSLQELANIVGTELAALAGAD